MKYDYMKEEIIHYSEIDSKAKLSLINVLRYLQNMSTEFFATMKTDNFTISQKNNAVWVITKTKVKFYKFPIWTDKIEIRIYSVKLSAIRYEVETTIKDKNNEILIIAKQEYCAMDITSRRVRKIATIDFPNDLEVEDEKYIDDYKKLRDELPKSDFIYSQKINSQDIDYSKHMNNVEYVRFILNIFSCDYLEKHEIDDFEIHYISETRENQVLDIYKRELNENEFEFLLKEQDKDVTRAYLKFK